MIYPICEMTRAQLNQMPSHGARFSGPPHWAYVHVERVHTKFSSKWFFGKGISQFAVSSSGRNGCLCMNQAHLYISKYFVFGLRCAHRMRNTQQYSTEDRTRTPYTATYGERITNSPGRVSEWVQLIAEATLIIIPHSRNAWNFLFRCCATIHSPEAASLKDNNNHIRCAATVESLHRSGEFSARLRWWMRLHPHLQWLLLANIWQLGFSIVAPSVKDAIGE